MKLRSTPRERLSAEELRKMHAYWRACNYLAVGMIYLRANPLLREPLQVGVDGQHDVIARLTVVALQLADAATIGIHFDLAVACATAQAFAQSRNMIGARRSSVRAYRICRLRPVCLRSRRPWGRTGDAAAGHATGPCRRALSDILAPRPADCTMPSERSRGRAPLPDMSSAQRALAGRTRRPRRSQR